MLQFLFSPDVFMVWHDWARTIAIGSCIALFVLIVLQYALSGSGGRAARFLNNGSLRTGLIVAFAFIATVPLLALGTLLAERSAQQRHDRMATRLERNTAAVARDVDHLLNKYVAGVSTAAATVSAADRVDAATLEQFLLIHHEIYADFLTMLIADRVGTVQAATSNMTGFLTAVEDLRLESVSDRTYFREPMATGKPAISKAFRGRGLGSDAIVAISAPLFDESGDANGVVEGSLNLKAFGNFHEGHKYLSDMSLLLLDQDKRVIYASADEGLSELEAQQSHPVVTNAALAGDRRSYVFVADVRDGKQRYLGAFATTSDGWTVYGRIPLDVVAEQVRADYAVSIFFVLLACALSLLAASAIVKRLDHTLRDMNSAIAEFRSDGTGEDITTPRSTPREFRPLFGQMRKRAKNLRRAHERLQQSIVAGENLRSELTQVIARKEAEIYERTLKLEEANQQLADQSRSDALTGIPNRREFDEVVDRMWRACARNNKPLAVILMDIDFFKIYNDTLGHQEGDRCLVSVANALHACAKRPLDLVARYGGEEFVAILGDAPIEDALIVAERMRNAVSDLQIEHPGSCHGIVTISAGAVAVVPRSDSDPKSLLKVADEALYYAKAAGRHCV